MHQTVRVHIRQSFSKLSGVVLHPVDGKPFLPLFSIVLDEGEHAAISDQLTDQAYWFLVTEAAVEGNNVRMFHEKVYFCFSENVLLHL